MTAKILRDCFAMKKLLSSCIEQSSSGASCVSFVPSRGTALASHPLHESELLTTRKQDQQRGFLLYWRMRSLPEGQRGKRNEDEAES